MTPEETTAPPAQTTDPVFQPLDVRVIKLWRVRHVIVTAVLIAIATVVVFVVGFSTDLWLWPIVGWQALLVLRLILLFWHPPRAYRAWGYRIDGKVLETRHGIWFRFYQLLPLSRLQ